MVIVEDFGVADYRKIWEYLLALHEDLKSSKKEGRQGREYILIGEHKDVYTLGRHGKDSNLLINESVLKASGKDVIRIERGGDITYHGPGQLIVYPIIDLEHYGLGVKGYVDLLEEAVIRVLNKYGIVGQRVEGATGVWINAGTRDERKICAIGVKISRYVTMHGIGFNINTDLRGFDVINPCGFTDKGVTSMSRELDRTIDMLEVKNHMINTLGDLLRIPSGCGKT